VRLNNDELWEKAGTDQPITMEDIGLEKTTTVIKNRNGLTIFRPYHNLKGNNMISIFIFLIIILLSVCFGALLAKYL